MGRHGELLAYNTKIIETPTTKEVWIYEEPIFHRLKKDVEIEFIYSDKKAKRKTFDDMSAVNQYNSLKRKQKHYEQMRWEISRLVDCNFDHKTYLATWEKQKRGAIHYHIIFFNFPYLPKKILEQLWGHGFIKINKVDVDSKENRGRYVSKYFSKDLELKEHKKKAFFKSQNLKLPYVKKTILTDEMRQTLEREPIIFTKEYNRQVFDRQLVISVDESGSPRYALKDSKVTYIKIKKKVESQNKKI